MGLNDRVGDALGDAVGPFVGDADGIGDKLGVLDGAFVSTVGKVLGCGEGIGLPVGVVGAGEGCAVSVGVTLGIGDKVAGTPPPERAASRNSHRMDVPSVLADWRNCLVLLVPLSATTPLVFLSSRFRKETLPSRFMAAFATPEAARNDTKMAVLILIMLLPLLLLRMVLIENKRKTLGEVQSLC